MTHALLPRSAWTSHGPLRPLTALVPAQVRGLAVHWPGSAGAWGQAPTLQQTAARLEAERVQHTSPSDSDRTKPWSDLAYNLAVDLSGRLLDGRGIAYRSAANGDATVNAQYVAVTVLMGPDDVVTPAAVDAVRAARALVLQRYPHATAVVGHRDLHGTACPGPQLYDLVRSGAFTTGAPAGQPTQEDDVPTADEIIDRLAARLQDPHDGAAQAIANVLAGRTWTVGWPEPTQGDPQHVARAQDRLVAAARGTALAPVLTEIRDQLAELRGGAVTGAGVDAQALADTLLQRAGARLAGQ